CYCARIYGERDFRAFGYLSVLKAPYTDDRIKKHWEKAAAMNAVPIRQDATDEEKEEATKRAEEQWEKMGRTASWGCAWYKRWFDLACTAVEKKQQLKAVFFPRQVGYGIPSMEDLSDCKVDLWDGDPR
ncbi:pbsA1, partial [Symbiodinium microadriaticum]